MTSPPMRRIRPDSSRRRGSAGSSVVSPSRFASGSKLAPWIRVEVTTTKKTIENSSLPAPTPATTGKVASQIGVAPRRPGPAEHRLLAQVERREDRRDEGGQRPGDRGSAPPRAPGPRPRRRRAWLGKTSRPSRTKRPIWATQPTPSWKATTVRFAGMLRRAERQRGQVGGEQAGAVGDLGEAEGEPGDRDRRHRVDPVGGQPHPAQRRDREPAHREPDRDPDRQFEDQR